VVGMIGGHAIGAAYVAGCGERVPVVSPITLTASANSLADYARKANKAVAARSGIEAGISITALLTALCATSLAALCQLARLNRHWSMSMAAVSITSGATAVYIRRLAADAARRVLAPLRRQALKPVLSANGAPEKEAPKANARRKPLKG